MRTSALAFAPSALLEGQTVTFTGTVAAGTTPITYTQDWGDQAGFTSQSGPSVVATHTFPLTATQQTYTVTLTAANVCPSSATTQQLVAVAPRVVYLPIVLR